ncbi:MAG: glycosyltransferase family 39 protein [Tepidisphaeraceae bacterium]|jgi:uncharacterized membrane protein
MTAAATETPQANSDRWRRLLASPAAAWLVIAIGALLRVYRFMQERGVMHSEAVLCYNILTRDFAGLFRPLESDQASPVGFLLMQKCSTLLLGGSEHALRLVPLLAGVLALPLFYRLAKSILTPRGALLAIGFLAFAEPLVRYSAEGKQYSTDVLWTIVVVWMALRTVKRADLIRLGIVGAILIWFCHPILFVLGGAGLTLAWDHLRRKQWPLLKIDLAIGAAWLASFAINYFAISHAYTGSSYLTDYWDNQNAFAPLIPKTAQQWMWYPRTLRLALEFPVGIAPGGNPKAAWILWVAAAGFVAGCLLMIRRQGRMLRVIAGTLLLALAASGLHKYPFGERLILFTAPLLIIPLALAIDALPSRPLRLIAAALFFIYPIYMQAKYAIHRPVLYDAKPAMAYVKTHWQTGDGLYLPWESAVLGGYYLHTQPDFAIPDAHPIRRDDLPAAADRAQAYTQDIQPLLGRPRVWIVFSMDPLRERALYEQIMTEHGHLLDRYDYPGGAAELYDLRQTR